MTHSITDIKKYNNRMSKTVIDKLFFLDYIFEPVEYIVDFGCADGTLLKTIKTLFGNTYKYIGYDNNPDMIQAAKENAPDITFTSDWAEINIPFENSLLVLSSVIHEIYSYCSEKEISSFWKTVTNSGFKYIAIRDMVAPNRYISVPNQMTTDYITKAVGTIKHSKYSSELDEYEKEWGKINNIFLLTHFLLKYHYTENFKRENKENYFAVTAKEIERKLSKNDYGKVMQLSFNVPYLEFKLRKDFGLFFTIPTHVKMVYRKR